MANAMVALATTTLSSAASTLTFSSIPASYRDLQIVVNLKGTGGNGLVGMRFNSDSGSNYLDVEAYGEGTAAGSSSATRTYTLYSVTSVGTDFNSTTIASVMDYAQVDKHKTTLIKYGNTNPSGVQIVANRWASTAAITSITFLFTGTDTFAAGTTFSLYGVVA